MSPVLHLFQRKCNMPWGDKSGWISGLNSHSCLRNIETNNQDHRRTRRGAGGWESAASPAPPPLTEFFKWSFSGEKKSNIRAKSLDFSGKPWRKHSGKRPQPSPPPPSHGTGPVLPVILFKLIASLCGPKSSFLRGYILYAVFLPLILTVRGQLTTGDNSPPDKTKAQLFPTRTTIPRTTPHRTTPTRTAKTSKTTHQDQYLHGGELSWWGVVRIRILTLLEKIRLFCHATQWSTRNVN